MNKIFIILIIILIIVGFVFVYNNYNKKTSLKENKFQGAVPQGYDEEYFRKTGITQKINNG